MEDPLNLKRYLEAQSNDYEKALIEIKNGKKTNHWMWYIFPQFNGIGRSSINIKYAIKSEQEAISYFKHPILGKRLLEITEALLMLENKTAFDILGHPDDLKLLSSMTLFDTIQSENNLFEYVLEKYFNGNKCNITIDLLNKE